jgi:hypothetical protein
MGRVWGVWGVRDELERLGCRRGEEERQSWSGDVGRLDRAEDKTRHHAATDGG